MQSFQRKKPLTHYIYSPVALLLLLVVVGLLGRATLRIYLKERESAQNLAQAKAELETLETKETDLDKEIKHLSTPEGIEEELRSKYAINKPGEDLVVIVDDKSATATEEVKEKESWWHSFLDFFDRD